MGVKLEAMMLTLLVLHLIGATLWVGGHLILALGILPQALREGSAKRILDFEARFKLLGHSALVIQILTGIEMARRMQPKMGEWFSFGSSLDRTIFAKLVLLGLTLVLAVHMKKRVLPGAGDDPRKLAMHVRVVTVLALGLLVLGASFKGGWVL
ncbi:MAG TPA: copper resistance protein CopD [Planctomycetes bacterium]|nr:copper resistance protein CopD [Planctomycetota bacterium]